MASDKKNKAIKKKVKVEDIRRPKGSEVGKKHFAQVSEKTPNTIKIGKFDK